MPRDHRGGSPRFLDCCNQLTLSRHQLRRSHGFGNFDVADLIPRINISGHLDRGKLLMTRNLVGTSLVRRRILLGVIGGKWLILVLIGEILIGLTRNRNS